MLEEELEEGAYYGALPFDYYVTVCTQGSFQFDKAHMKISLAEFFDFMLTFVWSYHDRARWVLAQTNSPNFTNEQIQILTTNQSIHERNICANEESRIQTVWLRTCYDEDLSEKYKEMNAEGEIDAEIGPNRYLDDSSRYAFDDGTPHHWRQVLVRVPGITDFMGIDDERGVLKYRSCKNDDEIRAQYEELDNEEERTLALKELEFQLVVYLLDREAIMTGLIRMLWLDEHGNSAWENRVEPSTTEPLAVAFLGCTQLSKMSGGSSSRGSLIRR
ncbi:hypothetical protein N7536_012141 [Penicillium majusculum]|nr:hypothetical protein N7536_012141 [Penicillium majusculum]